MNYPQLVSDLEELTRQLGVQLRYEKGDFEGGYCVLKEQKMMVVNKRLHDARKAASIAQALGEFDIEKMFMKPTIRGFIEDELAKLLKQK
jgi:hypothetical protein